MEKEQVDTLLQEIMNRYDNAGDMLELLVETRKEIKAWKENGMTGDIPQQELLAEWGILQDGHMVVEADFAEEAVEEAEPLDAIDPAI